MGKELGCVQRLGAGQWYLCLRLLFRRFRFGQEFSLSKPGLTPEMPQRFRQGLRKIHRKTVGDSSVHM